MSKSKKTSNQSIPTKLVKLNIQAECLYWQTGYPQPDPQLGLVTPIVNITYDDGTPVTGIRNESFTIVSYRLRDQPYLIKNFAVTELSNQLPSSNFKGVYKISFGGEGNLAYHIEGQNVYAIRVSFSNPNKDLIKTIYYGQSIVSVVIFGTNVYGQVPITEGL